MAAQTNKIFPQEIHLRWCLCSYRLGTTKNTVAKENGHGCHF